jgi:hypothetical protein
MPVAQSRQLQKELIMDFQRALEIVATFEIACIIHEEYQKMLVLPNQGKKD